MVAAALPVIAVTAGLAAATSVCASDDRYKTVFEFVASPIVPDKIAVTTTPVGTANNVRVTAVVTPGAALSSETGDAKSKRSPVCANAIMCAELSVLNDPMRRNRAPDTPLGLFAQLADVSNHSSGVPPLYAQQT